MVATDHALHLLLELLVEQGINKRINSRVEQDHGESYVKGKRADGYGSNIH